MCGFVHRGMCPKAYNAQFICFLMGRWHVVLGLLIVFCTCRSVEAGGNKEMQARAKATAEHLYFEFELQSVATAFGGDWIKFLNHKKKEESVYADSWRRSPVQPSPRVRAPDSVAEARALRMLQREFHEVIKTNPQAAVQAANRVVHALKAGDFKRLAEDCVFYGHTPEGARLCLDRLNSQKIEIQAAMSLIETDPPFSDHCGARVSGSKVTVSACLPRFTAPVPSTGMVAQVNLSFGPKVKRPDNGLAYPPRHQIELWWSGPVMPEANGPRYDKPGPGRPILGAWRFYVLVFPYSRQRYGRQ